MAEQWVRSFFDPKWYTVEWDPQSKSARVTSKVTGRTEAVSGPTRGGKMYVDEARLQAIKERLTAPTPEELAAIPPESEWGPPPEQGGFGYGMHYFGTPPQAAPTEPVAPPPPPLLPPQTPFELPFEYARPYTPAPEWRAPAPSLPPAPPPPERVPEQVPVEGVTPAEPKPPIKEPSKGPAGFEREVAVPIGFSLPSVDRLMELWQEVSGREAPEMREYFQHPQFGRVLAGKVPMWMAADPVWRLFLLRLGLLQQRVGEQ